MKILLISDTHGDLSRVRTVLDTVRDIDLIAHCGDLQHDAWELEDTSGIPVVSVKGNCDGARKPDRQIIDTPAGKILITHGHLEGAGYDYNKLLYLGEEQGCIAVCFGHTHAAMCEDFAGIWLINPGSLPRPRDGSGGTCAVLRCEEDDFHASIVHYDRIAARNPSGPPSPSQKQSPKKKVRGGFLRDMLNYSDRF
ncbi:MAG: metallophosphoesterase family protein [Emergencia sp.]